MDTKHLPKLALTLASSAALATAIPATTLAADNETKDRITEELVITANRLLQPQANTLAAVTIINQAEIRASLATSVADLLNGVPGVQFAPTGGQGSQTSLFMRGSESDHTLVLIDGVKVNTASEGFARLEFIPVDQIARVEIVRGPRSSIYGSEAIGGVVQIFTRQADKDNFSGNLTLSAGTEKTRNASVNLAGNVENTAYSLSYAHNETDGIDASQSVFSSDDRDGVERDSISAAVTHRISDKASVKANLLRTESESEFDDGINESTGSQASISADLKPRDNWASSLTLSYFEDDNENISFFGSTSKTERAGADWLNNITLSNDSSLVLGLDYQDEELDYRSASSAQTETTRDNLGVFAVYVGQNKVIDYTLSLRHDDNEQFGSHTTGSIAIGRDLSDSIHAWVSYGTAFKAPNLFDLYVSLPDFNYFSNPNLEPESSRNLELGIKGTHKVTRWSVNLFRNEIEDLITNNATFTSLTNIDETEILGLEGTLGTRVFGWLIDASLTLLDHENTATGEKLQRRPDESLRVDMSRSFGNLNVAANWLAYSDHDDVDPVTFGRSNVAGYGIVDVKIGYQVTPELKLRLKVGNLFDKDYEVVDGFNTYGRTALVSADYQF